MERENIPLFPLNTVLFPGMMLPLHIFEDRYKLMLKHCLAESTEFGVVLLESGKAEGPITGDVSAIGTTAQIRQVDAQDGDRFNIVTTGSRRFKVIEVHPDIYPYLTATVEYFPVLDEGLPKVDILAEKVAKLTSRYLALYKKLKGQRFRFGQLPTDPLSLAFLVGVILPVENDVKQEILSVPDAYGILKSEYDLLRHETLVLDLILSSKPSWAKSTIQFYPN